MFILKVILLALVIIVCLLIVVVGKLFKERDMTDRRISRLYFLRKLDLKRESHFELYRTRCNSHNS